jgi:hypothetical protein
VLLSHPGFERQVEAFASLFDVRFRDRGEVQRDAISQMPGYELRLSRVCCSSRVNSACRSSVAGVVVPFIFRVLVFTVALLVFYIPLKRRNVATRNRVATDKLRMFK